MPLYGDMDDGQDAVAWLRRQPWFDGRVATYGASGVGWTQWALLVDPPPELRTSIIISGLHDLGRSRWGTGAFTLHDMLTWARVTTNQEGRFGLARTPATFTRAAQANASTGSLPATASGSPSPAAASRATPATRAPAW